MKLYDFVMASGVANLKYDTILYSNHRNTGREASDAGADSRVLGLWSAFTLN